MVKLISNQLLPRSVKHCLLSGPHGLKGQRVFRKSSTHRDEARLISHLFTNVEFLN